MNATPPVPTLPPSSAVYIQQGRLVTGLRLLWLVVAATTLLMYAASIPITFEKLTILCDSTDCLLLQLTETGESTLRQVGLSLHFYIRLILLAEAFVLAAYTGIGSMIFWRKPLDVMVVVFSFLSITWVTVFVPSIVLLTDVSEGLDIIKMFIQGAGICLGVLFVLLFPDGHFFPRWSRWYFLITVIALFAGFLNRENTLVGFIFRFWDLREMPPGFFIVIIVISSANVIFQVQRYRTHSTPLQRQQTKWVLTGLVLLIGFGFATLSVPVFVFPQMIDVNNNANILYVLFALISYALLLILFPITVLFSALRYRLWDVDIVLNRTLVYGGLTLLLGGIFVAAFFGLKGVWEVILGSGQEVVAAVLPAVFITLVFNPTRKRVQHFVDRRIYGLNFDLNQLAAAQKLPDIKNPGALSGRKLGGYNVLDVIGKGGMGEVYKGQANGQTVAIKILPEDLAKEEHFRQRFAREGQALTALHHANIVRMIVSGESEGVTYLAMEFVEGEELGRKLKAGGALSLEDTRDILKGLASALDYAHEQGFIHRDIKPSNVMVRKNKDGETWEGVLMDFGVAKVREAASGLTQTGAIGTIDYMAPEQIMSAKEVDRRADVYALGIMTYEMLTGERPFKGGAAQVMFAHLQQPAPDPCDVKDDVPRDIAKAIMKAMEKKPEERFATAGEFAAAVDS